MVHFVCYLHKAGLLTPEIRFVACEDEQELPDAITDQLAAWPRFELLEVCNTAGEKLFRIEAGHGSAVQ